MKIDSFQYVFTLFFLEPKSVKRSVLFSMFLRAYRLSSPNFLYDEIEYLYGAFAKRGYPKNFIISVHREVKKKFFNPSSNPLEREKLPTLRLPFNSFTNRFLTPILRCQKINVVHKSENTLRARLHKTRPHCEGGVYIIPCQECQKCYIGQTGRKLDTRILEHKYYVSRGMKNKAVYRHMHDENHALDWKNASMVYRSGKEKERLVVESALIKYVPNFNLTLGAISVNEFTGNCVIRGGSLMKKVDRVLRSSS